MGASSLNDLTLSILLQLKDQASEGLKSITGFVEDHSRAIGRAGMRMAMLGGIVLGVVALAMKSANAQAALAGQTARLQENYQKLASTVASALIPIVLSLLNMFNSFLEFLNKINPGLSENAIRFIAIGAAVLVVVGTLAKFGMMIVEIVKLYKTLITQQAISAALSGPLGWANLAMAAAVGVGGYAAMKHFETAPSSGGYGMVKPAMAPASGGGYGTTNVNISGGPLIMSNHADMQKFARQVSAQQRIDTKRTTSRYP